MARPTLDDISQGTEGWEATVNDNKDKLTSTPAPLAVYANEVSLPSASSYQDCLAIVQDDGTGHRALAVSNGSTWELVSLS